MQLWLIPIFPLAGFLINGIFGRRFSKSLVNTVAIGSVVLSFLWVVKTILAMGDLNTAHLEHYFTWIQSGVPGSANYLNVGVDFAIDRLTIVMLLVVTGIGSLIHIYSIGYMAHEHGPNFGGYYRFFAYLNLFMFFMLVLVLGASFLLLFVGWEGVGLCSYLLIGFYFDKKFATNAGNKAFIVNRIGDFGFALAMFLIFRNFGSLDFAEVFHKAPGATEQTLTLIGLLLLVGACGKSAQIPLYVWLPDAMAGPTPVSALIHAATMVTAGVYMTARSWVIFTHAPGAMDVIAVIGIATAFLAATIGLAQNDIKKVFAYSTVSQLGYMFVGIGSGAFSAGVYHLMTHAFFKALLFLGAGSVIHALSGEQDMRNMGGLRKKIPITFWTMCCAWVAISGVPPFSGFFSKDAILLAAYQHSPAIYWIGIITAGMTAFYVSRAMFMTFFGSYRGNAHPHESPAVMWVPLAVLAVLSLVGGWLFPIPEFLKAIFPAFEESENHMLMYISVFAGFAGIALAYLMYLVKPGMADSLARTFNAPYQLIYNKYFVDEIYDAAVVRPLVVGSRFVLWKGVDAGLIDGIVNGVGARCRDVGSVLRLLQSGNIRSYATWVLFGSVALIVAINLLGGLPAMNLLTLVLFLPLAAFLVALCIPRAASAQGSRMWALVSSLGIFVASLGLLAWFDREAAGEQFMVDVPWIGTPNIHFAISVNGVSLWLILLATLLTPLCVLVSWNSIKDRAKEFFAFLLLLEFGLVGVFLAQDLFLFYVFWEVCLVPMYFLVGIWGHDRRIYAAVKFFLYTMAGSVLMLAAIIYIYNKTLTFSYPAILDMLSNGKLTFPPGEQMLLFLAFFIAFAIKVPLFPLHTWLPDAHVEAPAAGSIMLAGVMLKMGTYGILHFCLPMFPSAARACAPWIGVLAIIGIIYGSLVALVQPNMKKLVAYTSVAHLGFVVLGIFSFTQPGLDGAVYQMLNHGVSTGALFLLVGILYERRHSLEIVDYGGVATVAPWLSITFLVTTLASIGLPTLNNFVGEFLVLQGTAIANFSWAVWASLGVILSACYMLWLYQRVFYGETGSEVRAHVPDLNLREWAAILPLIVMMVWMGVYSQTFLPPVGKINARIIEQTNVNVPYRVQSPPTPRVTPATEVAHAR